MEQTIVQFIIENVYIFLPLGAAGIIATIVLFFLPSKATTENYVEAKPDYITFLKFRLNVFVVVYLFIWIAILIIGLFSDFLVPTLVGGTIAAIPIIVLTLLESKTNKKQVS